MKTTTLSKIQSVVLHATVLACASILFFAFSPSSLYAQDGVIPSFEAGPYTFNMGLMAGFRSVTTSAYGGNPSEYWDQQRYYEAMNYRTGVNINSFNLYGSRSGSGGFFD